MLRIPMLCIALMASVVLANPLDKTSAQATPYEDAEAYKVYSAILPQEWSWQAVNAGAFVIRIETEPLEICIDPDKESSTLLNPPFHPTICPPES